MTDTQLMILCISIVFPLAMLLYSNSRIGDAKETLRADIGEAKQAMRAETAGLRTELRTETSALRTEMITGFARIEGAIERLEHKLAIHELEHHK